MKMPTEAELRTEFHRLQSELDKAHEELDPIQGAYEAKRAEIEQVEQRQLKPLGDKLKLARQSMHAIQQEIALIARMLKGRVGEPPAEAA